MKMLDNMGSHAKEKMRWLKPLISPLKLPNGWFKKDSRLPELGNSMPPSPKLNDLPERGRSKRIVKVNKKYIGGIWTQ